MSHETIINPAVREAVAQHAQAFANAEPFRHVVIDDFLDRAYIDDLLREFPAFERGNYIGDDGRPGGKSTVDAMPHLGPAYRRLDEVIQTPAFLAYIGRITGIDDLLYDPFIGSGTAIIAAQKTGRRCLGIELEPRYVQMAINRWQAYTTQTAVQIDEGMAEA